MDKCIVCGKEREDFMVRVIVDGKEGKCCPECFDKIEGHLTQVGYDVPLKEPDPKADKHVDLYYRVPEEHFGNAGFAKLSFTYEKDTMTYEDWQRIGILHLVASALLIPNDIDRVVELIKANDDKTLSIAHLIKPITKEEYDNRS